MGSKEFQELCKKVVLDYYNDHKEERGITSDITMEDVYVVWYCKTLQNHKALLSTTVPDTMYYELTYNGDKRELYFDAYKKEKNIRFHVCQIGLSRFEYSENSK